MGEDDFSPVFSVELGRTERERPDVITCWANSALVGGRGECGDRVGWTCGVAAKEPG